MGYTPSTVEQHRTEGTILVLSRLDTWIACIVTLTEVPMLKGARAQKKYELKTSKLYLPTLEQLMRAIFEHTRTKCPESVTHVAVSGAEARLTHEPTEVCRSLKENCQYLRIKPDWFVKHISPHLGYVLDCFVGMASHNDVVFHELTLPTEPSG